MASDRTAAARPAAKRKYVIRDLRSGGKRQASRALPESPEPAAPTKTRDEMVAEAAYYRAMRRGFVGGDRVRDWLEAEREIDAKLRADE